MPTTDVYPTQLQTAILQFCGHANILSAGGRGSGKTVALILDLLAHCRDFGSKAAPLVTRESHGGLLEIRMEVLELARAIFGDAQQNKAENVIYLPTGGVISFTNISDDNSYAKHQGRTYTGLYADEAGNYSPTAFAFMLRLMSNLRVASGKRPAVHISANPHGRSHTTLFKTLISKAPAWHPFEDETGDLWVWTTSNLKQNPHIDQDQYIRKLKQSCGQDHALAEAWIDGDWSVLGGNMFQHFSPEHHVIRPLPYIPSARCLIGGDWGTASPSAAILLAYIKESFGHYRTGDVIAIDETDTADPNDLSVGLGYPPQTFAEMVKEMAARNGVKRPQMVMDDARGLQGDTVVSLMRDNGLSCRKPRKKDRVGTWALINNMLHSAKTGEGGPGLWITTNCPHLIETLPEAPRGALRPEDLDPRWNYDHHLDALGYGLRDLTMNRSSSGFGVRGALY
ncbi:MAG: terminase family protein [Planctomycetota bacterium]